MLLLTNILFLQLACDEPTKNDPQEDTASSSDTASPSDTASSSDTPDVDDELVYAGEIFSLREVEGETLIEMLGIFFNADGEHLSFGGVCNEHFGSFEIIDDALHFTWEGA
ncbi:MAG: hypothetical protein CMK59_05285, partial [Proteobacteria bacterium]|nr:hypothetical protein [Pseudomonadota bacterium]